ncbi:MAG: LCP family protein, partial [Clostridium sp.]|nr:LCP family protein [Clostridium sp.]
MSNRGKGQMNLADWFKGLSYWNKLAVVIFGLTSITSVWLLGTIISLTMLPTIYLAVIILLVVLFLFGTYKALFITGFGKKKKNKKKTKNAVLIRLLGLILALSLVLVDAVGISMISQLQGAIGDMTIGGGTDAVVYEVIGVYVKADDHADELKDVSAYDKGISYAYSKENMEKAVTMMEESFGKEFTWDEYETVVGSMDALLAGEVDVILMSTSYIAVIEGMEGCEDIQSKVKLIHEFQVEDENATVLNLDTKPEDMTKEPFIVYISGNDTNYSLTNQRSDVNILAVVNPVTKQVLLVNTPRDYYIELVGSQEADGEMDKLTHCGIYGIECSMATLGDLYDQDVHYYAQVSFVGFKRLIDAMGGINVYSDQSFFSSHSETYVEKGYNYMNGEEALSFVRERKNLPDGDNARGRHQMAVIRAIIDKAVSGAILTHYGDILDSMGSCFGTNLTGEEASNLVKMQLGDMASWNIKSFSV